MLPTVEKVIMKLSALLRFWILSCVSLKCQHLAVQLKVL